MSLKIVSCKNLRYKENVIYALDNYGLVIDEKAEYFLLKDRLQLSMAHEAQ